MKVLGVNTAIFFAVDISQKGDSLLMLVSDEAQ